MLTVFLWFMVAFFGTLSIACFAEGLKKLGEHNTNAANGAFLASFFFIVVTSTAMYFTL